MIDQRKSPLFRLPRELRDEIYSYCAYDEDGLFYDYPSRKLRSRNNEDLGLLYTCKAIALEMQGLWHRVNTITFTPAGGPDDVTSNSRRSIASRFEHLLYATRWTRMLMLHHAAECVTDNDMAKVTEAFPSVSSVFRSTFRAIRCGSDLGSVSRLSNMPRDIFIASLCDAVQYTLDLAATHPKFEELISKACESPQYYPWSQPPFIQGSHLQVLRWRPMPWLIPTHDDICGMEDLLTVLQGPTKERAKTYEGVNFYFSATAICIATLGRLTPTTRKHLRSIILQEDCRSLGNPEVHAEGLITYCTENRKLQFLMEASFSTMLAPSFWTKPDQLLTYSDTGTRARVHDYIRILVDWLMRTAALTKLGMPKTSYVVVLDAHSPQAIYLWQYISKAASARAHIPEELLNHEDHVNVEREVLPVLYQLLWRLPAGLSSVVEDIRNDVSIVRLKIPDSERLSRREPAKPYATWSFMDWCLAYTPTNHEVMFPGDADAYFEKFFKKRV